MSTVSSLSTLGGKPFVKRYRKYLLKISDLILDFLLSQHKLNHNHNVFGINTCFVVIGVEKLKWTFNAVFHS